MDQLSLLDDKERFFLVVDVECTCGPGITRDLQEIIEIGAVLLTSSFEIKGRFQCYVRPEICVELTPFCKDLTGIKQEWVDAGISFPEAIEKLTAFIGETAPVFCSWGNFDRAIFKNLGERHQIELPFKYGFINLMMAFSETLGVRKGFKLEKALHRKGLTFVGKPHSGIDDAVNTARLLPYCGL